MRRLHGVCALLILLVSPVLLHAQATGTVRGTVTELGSDRPLSGAQVFVPGTSLGTLTDEMGRFLLVNVPAGNQTVRATLIGYGPADRTVSVAAGQTATVNIRLESEAVALQEIVVTGVAGATTRAKVPFSISKVDAEDIPVPTVSAGSAIQGKVAGAQVIQGSGRPGAAPSILLRGATSINSEGRSQEPLFIVDGVILAGSMVDMDALDIESVEVIKGAAGASLYGSRAANGVIQIRTKRGAGAGDDGVRYTVRSEYGVSELAGTPEALLSERHPYAMQNGQFTVGGQPCQSLETCPGTPDYAGQAAAGQTAGVWNTFRTQQWPGQSFDQVQRFFEDGQFLQNYVSAEGRTGATNFHVSFSNLGDEGIIPGQQGFRRNNFRLNLDQAVRENFAVSASAFYSRSEADFMPESQGNPIFELTRVPAGVNLEACEPSANQGANASCRNDPQNLILQPDPLNNESVNPLYILRTRQYEDQRNRFLGSATLRYSPLAFFDIDANVSYDRLNAARSDMYPKGYRTLTPDPDFNEGNMALTDLQNEALNSSLTGTFRFDLGDNVRNRTQLRYLYERWDENFTYTEGARFRVAEVPVFQNLDPEFYFAQSGSEPIRSDGYFAITNFDIADRYILDALIRNDGSSLFGEDERRQWYYRLAGAWRMSLEPWFNLPAVDEFKLRYAYGTAGGRPRFEAQYETYSITAGGVVPMTLGNRELKPEFSREQEAGVDASFLDGRLVLGLTYANAVTSDQILQVPLPSYTGYQSQWRNAGTLESNTWEASLDARLYERGSFSWTGRVLFDRTRSEITDLNVAAYATGFPDDVGQDLDKVFYIREGEEIGSIYGIRVATECGELPQGFNCNEFATNQDGLLVWVGPNGSLSSPQWGSQAPGTINGRPVMWGSPVAAQCADPVSGDATYFCKVGRTTPDYHASLSSTVNWRGLSVYGLLDALQGFDVYNRPLQWAIFTETSGLPDDDAERPIGYYSQLYAVSNLVPSSLFVEDGSFVKLRELAVRYRFGADRLTGIPGLNNFSGLGLSLIGRNLLTWTNYRGFDPEVGIGDDEDPTTEGGALGSAALARIEGYQYPNFRTWTLAVELNF